MTTKVLPINYIDDMEDIMAKDKCSVIGIEEMSITYTQPADTNSTSDETQHITVTTRMAESVGMEEAAKREGFYFNITIPEGEHWSIEDANDLKAIVDDFKERLYRYDTGEREQVD